MAAARPSKQHEQLKRTREKAPSQPQAATAAAVGSLLSLEDLKKERSRAKNKNKYKRNQPTKNIDEAELQIEGASGPS